MPTQDFKGTLTGTGTFTADETASLSSKAPKASPSFSTGIGIGGIAAGAGGIAFPATQVAVADVNTLDDYEEGTWTMALTFGGGNTGITYTLNTGNYTKTGNQVSVRGLLLLSSKGSSTGIAVVGGLPFTIANSYGTFCSVAVKFTDITVTGQFQAYALQASTNINLEQLTSGVLADLLDTNFANGSAIAFNFTYNV